MSLQIKSRQDNIDTLLQSQQVLQEKYEFFKSNSSMNQQPNAGEETKSPAPLVRSQTTQKKNQPSALTKYLFDIGATKEEVENINSSLIKMLESADIKQEDMTDTIQLLRKFEIKFYELCEVRDNAIAQGTQQKITEITEEENRLAKQRRLDKMAERSALADFNKQKKDAEMAEKTKKRNELLVIAGKRDNARSTKPQLDNKKVEKPVINQDEADMNLYVGDLSGGVVMVKKENHEKV